MSGSFLGHFHYLDAKIEKARIMESKQSLSKVLDEVVLQDPRGKAKSRLFITESSWGWIFHPSMTTSTIDAISFMDY
jgi:hypothetical protein